MRAFVAAKRQFLVHLRPEDIADAIHDESAETALSALVEWGNLRADPASADRGSPSTIGDGYANAAVRSRGIGP
jgi:hypothetical protein